MKKLLIIMSLLLTTTMANADWIDEIKKLPSVGDAGIQSSTLVIFPQPGKISESNYPKLAKILCFNAKAQGFDMVRFMDSMEYLTTGKFKVHSRRSC